MLPGFLARISEWLHSITFRAPHSHSALKYNQVVPAMAPAMVPVEAPAASKALTAECASEVATDRSASPSLKTP